VRRRSDPGTDRFGALDLGALAAATAGFASLFTVPAAAPALLGAALVFAAAGAAGPLAPLAAAVLPLPIEQRAVVGATAVAAVVALAVSGRRVGSLEHAARIDQLTGLYRYEAFSEAAQLELQRAARYGNRVSLIVFDLDRFKQLNDRFGHAVGNVMLEECGLVVRETLRTTDIAGRFGGEEIVALVYGDARRAHIAAERVREAVSSIAVDTARGEARVTVSAGIANAGPGTDLDTLFAAADAALYEAKRRGRNRTVLATAEMLDAA
jgi:diguanylate cyclase (GGDEF)-like protein